MRVLYDYNNQQWYVVDNGEYIEVTSDSEGYDYIESQKSNY